MKEKAVIFGETKQLIGIMTPPDKVAPSNALPAVILINAGIIHRIGPHRLYVKLARTLASAGYPALRFDLSGIGDSGTTTDKVPFKTRVISDTKQAMDFLAASQGVNRFILLGICAGAQNSIRVANEDKRVVGAILIDIYGFKSTGFRLHGYCEKLFTLRSWYRFMTGRSDFWGILRDEADKFSELSRKLPASNFRNQNRTKQKMVAELRTLIDRHVRLFLIYTGQHPSYYNYRKIIKKGLRSVPSNKQPQVKYFPHADHTFTLLSSQRLLVEAVHDWVINCLTIETRSREDTSCRAAN